MLHTSDVISYRYPPRNILGSFKNLTIREFDINLNSVYHQYVITMTTTISRINITLPKNLATELRKVIPERERSKIIAEALKEKITRMKREESLKKLKGIWDKAGGVSFRSNRDLRTWRRSLWSSAEKRFTKRISG